MSLIAAAVGTGLVIERSVQGGGCNREGDGKGLGHSAGGNGESGCRRDWGRNWYGEIGPFFNEGGFIVVVVVVTPLVDVGESRKSGNWECWD